MTCQKRAAGDWNLDITVFDYDTEGRIELITRPNGVTSDYSYDPAGRLDRIDHTGPGGVIDFYDYDYDNAGNRTSMTSAAGVENYTIVSVLVVRLAWRVHRCAIRGMFNAESIRSPRERR